MFIMVILEFIVRFVEVLVDFWQKKRGLVVNWVLAEIHLLLHNLLTFNDFFIIMVVLIQYENFYLNNILPNQEIV